MKHFYFPLKTLTVIVIATLYLGGQETKAQTLAKGDIAFVKVNETTSDGFSFVTLVNIPATTQIYFTDNSWGNGVWNSGEAHFLYTPPAGGLTRGTVVHCDETSTNNVFNVTGGGTMTVQATTSPNFSIAGGDQIIAYQSTTGAKPANPSFIAAINTDDGGAVQTSGLVMLSNETTGWISPSNWDLSTKGGQGSVLPAGLTNGIDAVGMFPQAGGGAWVGKEQFNMRYDCTKGTTGTKAELLDKINNRANWVFNNTTDIPNNAVCSFTVTGALPVELVQFNAKAVINGVENSWQTASETNSSHFELLHSSDEGGFKLLTKVDALGDSKTGKHYSFTHTQPVNGNNYYQLIQFDKDGAQKDYGIKTVNFKSVSKDEVLLFPNPATHSITVTFAAKTYSTVQIVDMLGKIVRSQKISTNDTEQKINVEALTKGTYMVELIAESEKNVLKFIKL